ncbi:uncharacterized protein BDW47DRAFT_118327 [Aspergillus candidus]|uniref:non-specific serine/threonine protein kinase n=1 Tax=Aspergillus candidus TaxID=41067 RepID=A0A2I2F8T1_ASPCN|nr:hypothetical protein BDW47DRAFT_118327 [Aspergillus candidus]PLB37031.1 hypothetical protein BDW47DRAFT_118327 [Aspergillus candidus]
MILFDPGNSTYLSCFPLLDSTWFDSSVQIEEQNLPNYYPDGYYLVRLGGVLNHSPLGISSSKPMQWIPGQAMTLEDLKPCIRQLLVILDFLHSEANVIHTDLQLKNLLLPVPDQQTLSSFEEAALKAPAARKEHDEDIMPNVYRSPEVILKMKWATKLIYGILPWLYAWDIVCPHTLFDGRNFDGIFNDRVHLAELIALPGPPPHEFCQKSKVSSVFWNEPGNWTQSVPLPNTSLECLAVKVRGAYKRGFLRWLRTALQRNPADRPTALEFIYGEWMMKELNLRGSKPVKERDN